MQNLAKALAAFQAKHYSANRGGKGNYGQYVTLADALQAVQRMVWRMLKRCTTSVKGSWRSAPR